MWDVLHPCAPRPDAERLLVRECFNVSVIMCAPRGHMTLRFIHHHFTAIHRSHMHLAVAEENVTCVSWWRHTNFVVLWCCGLKQKTAFFNREMWVSESLTSLSLLFNLLQTQYLSINVISFTVLSFKRLFAPRARQLPRMTDRLN